MVRLKCMSCGAPIYITEQERRSGLDACEYCGNKSILPKHLRMDLIEPAPKGMEKPHGSPIGLAMTDNLLRIEMPARGWTAASGGIGFFALFWCGFMVVWNVIGIVSGQPVMLLFGLIHDAVGVFLALWVLFAVYGSETVLIDRRNCLITQRLFRWSRRQSLPTAQISGAEVETSYGKNGPSHSLKLQVGVRQVQVGINAVKAELEWLAEEINSFLARVRQAA